MTAVEQALRNVLSSLDSNKITERKKAIDDLTRQLQNEDTIQYLHRHTRHARQSNVDWDMVFYSAHKVAINEASRIRAEEFKKDNASDATIRNWTNVKDMCSNLITLVVNKANLVSEVPKLKAKELVNSVMQVLDDEYLLEVYGNNCYLPILDEHLLKFKKYWPEISSRQWNDIMERLWKLFTTSDVQVNKRVVTDILIKSVFHGSMQSYIILKLRTRFRDLSKAFSNQEFQGDEMLMCKLLQLCIAVCQQVAKESRVASCRFGEENAMAVMHLYEYLIEEKKNLIFEFLLLQMKLHHPLGAKEGDHAAYACSWLKWKKMCLYMYSLIETEIENLQKLRFNTKDFMLQETFLNFAVAVFKQVFENNSDAVDITILNETNGGPSAPKRRRVEIGIAALRDKIESSSESYIILPWLIILTKLISTYPTLVRYTEFPSLLTLAAELIGSCKDPYVTNHLCEYAAVLLEVESHLEAHLVDDVTLLWNRIVNATLRNIGLNQSERGSHNLIQSLIKHKKVESMLSLVNLYVSGELKLSFHSVSTLDLVLQTYELPDTVPVFLVRDSSRKLLLNWLLPEPDENSRIGAILQSAPSPILIGKTLVRLIVKGLLGEHENKGFGYESKWCYSVEEIYKYNSFEKDLLVEIPQSPHVGDSDIAHIYNPRLDVRARDELINLLQRNTEALLNAEENFEDEENGNKLNFVLSIFPHIAVIFSVVSYMMKYNVISEEELITHRLSQIAQQLLTRGCLLCNQFLSVRETDVSVAYRIVSCFENIFALKLQQNVSELIRNCVPEDLELSVCSLLPPTKIIRTSQEHEKYGAALITFLDRNKLRKKVAKTLQSYFFYSDHELSDTHNTRFIEVLQMMNEEFRFHNDCDFEMAEMILKSAIELQHLDVNTINQILVVLQSMCKAGRCNQYGTAPSIISLLTGLICHVAKCESLSSKQNCIILVRGCFANVDKRRYGPQLHCQMIKCFAEFEKFDPTCAWSHWVNQQGFVSDEILPHMSSPFHEVRMMCARYVGYLFSLPPKDNLSSRQKDMFQKLTEEIMSAFSVEVRADLKGDEVIDEGSNRVASVLHALVSVIVVSPHWRRDALFKMIHLSHEKNINKDLMKIVLRCIRTHLKLESDTQLVNVHLRYCLSNWLQSNLSVESFPFDLLNCSSKAEFYTSYQHIVTPLVICKQDESLFSHICEESGITPSDLIEGSYSSIMACVLPYLAIEETRVQYGISTEKIRQAKSIQSNLRRILGLDKMNELLASNFADLIIEIIRLVYDTENFISLYEEAKYLPEPNPPTFTVAVLHKVLQYFQSICQPETPIIVLLAKEVPGKLQSILLNLICDVHKMPTEELKLQSFHSYAIFVDILANFLENEGGLSDTTDFLIYDICHTLVNLISGTNHDNLALTASKLLERFCRKCLAVRNETVQSKAISKCLATIVSCLVPLAKRETNVGLQVLNVLTYLIVDCADILKKSIKALDPFPLMQAFEPLSQVHSELKYSEGPLSLEEEIVMFLNGKKINRLEGLQHLRKQISERKWELRHLYEELHIVRGFSEDCARSVLHRLIHTLIELAGTSDDQVSLEASRCLGELGPSDLTTIILKPENIEMMKEFKSAKGTPLLNLTGCTISLLADCLVDSDVTVVQAASSTLYSIFCTKEGSLALNSHISSSVDKIVLAPFIGNNDPKSCVYSVDEQSLREELDHIYLWSPGEFISHCTWVTRLVCKILNVMNSESSFFGELKAVCRVKVTVSEEILPLLIHLLVSDGNENCRAIVSNNIRNFFKHHYELQQQAQAPNMSSVQLNSYRDQICLNKASIKCMLNVIHYIRLQSYNGNGDTYNLDLDYLHIAKAALFCDAYFTSVLYAELYCESITRDKMEIDSSQMVLDYIWEKHGDSGLAVQDVLRQTYSKLGLVDAISGCGSSHLLDPHTRVHSLELNGQWAYAVQFYDLELSEADSISSEGMMQALYNFGTHNLLRKLSQTVSDSKFQKMQYECCWRLNQWDLPVSPDEPHYNEQHYRALKSIHESDFSVAKDAVISSHQSIIQMLKNVSLESCKSVYPALSKLRTLGELESFIEFLIADSKESFESLSDALKNYNKIIYNNFNDIEPILSQRITLLKIASKKSSKTKSLLRKILIDSMLETAALARQEGWLQVSQRCLHDFKNIPDLGLETSLKLRIEEAQVSWAMGNKDTAIFLLRSVINSYEQEDSKDSDIHVSWSKALKLFGIWMMETKSENAHTIIEEYFCKSVKLICDQKDHPDAKKNRLETYACLARFADAQYQTLNSYMKSPEFEIKQKGIAEALVKSKEMSSNKLSASADVKKACFILNRQSDIDKAEIKSTELEKDKYLILAMKYYLKSLKESDINDLFIFRVVSLWLDNSSHENLLNLMDAFLDSIPSYKFVLLLTQLAARISSNTENSFTSQINKVFEKCAVEHPHHTLPVLLAIANLYLDQTYSEDANKSALAEKMKEPRLLGARSILKNVRSSVVSILKPMEDLQRALVSLAYWKAGDKATTIPKSEPIRKIKDFSTVLVPTIDLSVDKNRQYKNIVGVAGFESSFSFCGGVNVPKRIVCIGTDGVKRPMLVKGKDDLRQDAVMQQVFTILNMLLRDNSQTHKEKLLIGTYKVVPLSQRSGVLEWCQETQPVIEYLTDRKNGACQRYYPQDLNPADCRRTFFKAASSSADEKLRVFHDICRKTHPVLHYFFLENFRTPGVWFERRLAFIHSVATSSMIGYILGLGDRHFQNILLDKKTAEFIHIDFGIAFEQGRTLPTPETVPFRLTRNVVDGMGVCGIEGIFRKCCEKTMSVLRQNKETIITILEVLLYDPLYIWTLTPSQAYKIQNEKHHKKSLDEDQEKAPTGEVNKLAERALLRLRQKLDGTEDGTPSSVAGQVNRLLQEARDPMNLCRLYHGWQPYL